LVASKLKEESELLIYLDSCNSNPRELWSREWRGISLMMIVYTVHGAIENKGWYITSKVSKINDIYEFLLGSLSSKEELQ